MKILGEPIFAKDENGRLKSRVGTIFLTVAPGLVTQNGIHAMQRQAWIDEVNRERSAEGLLELTDQEIEQLIAHSVDLIFFDDVVLIRPDPARMDLALWADEELQKLVSKRKIRFLNTHAKRVRDALRARGENWRMARDLRAREEVDRQIERGRTAIRHEPIYFYNGNTGTRYVTVGTYTQVKGLDDAAFRAQIEEVVSGLNSRNRLGSPDIDLFPPSLDPAVRTQFKDLKPATLSDAQLREAVDRIELAWRMALPPGLRDEDPVSNLVWRAEMGEALSRKANETDVGDHATMYRRAIWQSYSQL